MRALQWAELNSFCVILNHKFSLIIEVTFVHVGPVRPVDFSRSRIYRQLLARQGIVCSALIAAGRRVSAFGMCHDAM